MRKLLSILLLCLFGLPLATPLLALGQTSEGRLPACCRKGGDHHCMGNMPQQGMAEREISPNPRFGVLTTRCPYGPATVTLHADLILAPNFSSNLGTPVPQPLVAARNASMQRIAQDRSRPKRGPPQLA